MRWPYKEEGQETTAIDGREPLSEGESGKSHV